MNGRPRSGSEQGNAWVMFLDQGHYRLSPRVQMWKSILAKIRPEPPNASLAPKGWEPKPEPLPPQKHYEPPRARRRRR